MPALSAKALSEPISTHTPGCIGRTFCRGAGRSGELSRRVHSRSARASTVRK